MPLCSDGPNDPPKTSLPHNDQLLDQNGARRPKEPNRLHGAWRGAQTPSRCGLPTPERVAKSARRPTLTVSARAARGLPCRKGSKCAARATPLLTTRKRPPRRESRCPQPREQSSMRQYGTHLDCRAAKLIITTLRGQKIVGTDCRTDTPGCASSSGQLAPLRDFCGSPRRTVLTGRALVATGARTKH